MKEIVIIAPIKSTFESAQRVVEDYGFGNIEVRKGNMGEGLGLAHQCIAEGVKVIVSRGGTYEMIKAETDIPLVEVKVTAFDIIESLKEAKKSRPKGLIGVIGYPNVIFGADVVAEVMGMRTKLFAIERDSDIVAEVEEQIDLGIRVFVGDGNVESAISRSRSRFKSECKTILVKSGSQAIRNAIQEAEEILYAARQAKEKAQQFATIIDFVQDGIVAIDNRGAVTVFNSASEKITGMNRQDVLGRDIASIMPEVRLLNVLTTMRQEIGDIQQLNKDKVIATNRIPVIVDDDVRGAVATYQDITEVQKLEQKIRIRLSEKGFVAQYRFSDIIHQSQAMAECIKTAQKFSCNDASALISGPSGTGKELFAQGIHNDSKRKNSPFVAINCAALPEALIESELFGYVEGSFTGASKKGKVGLFEMAHGGTIFLDEISELPIVLQGRLLRVLQEKEVMRLGDSRLIPVDVRVICASNRNLREMVAQKQFRGDLYFRIAILSLYIPALNNRLEDVEILSAHFVNEAAQRYRRGEMRLGTEALTFLRHYDYEGNVRELQGMIERAVVICESNVIGITDLVSAPDQQHSEKHDESGLFFPDGQTLEEIENHYIEYVFQKTNGSIKASSTILGIDRTTLWRRIKGKRTASAKSHASDRQIAAS